MSRKEIKRFIGGSAIELNFNPTPGQINWAIFKLSKMEPLQQEDIDNCILHWRREAVNRFHDWSIFDQAFELVSKNRGISQEIRDKFLETYKVLKTDEGYKAWCTLHSRRSLKMTAEEMDAAGIEWQQPEELPEIPPYWTNQ